jgi:hypothetical protein
MGIELELHSERPAFHWGKSRATLVRGSYDNGEALACALARLDRNALGKLCWVDPYGNTVFNEQEAGAALREVPGPLQQRTCEWQEAAVHGPGGTIGVLRDNAWQPLVVHGGLRPAAGAGALDRANIA